MNTQEVPAATAYWSEDADALLRRLGTSRSGLSDADAQQRLHDVGPNLLRGRRQLTRLHVVSRQLRSPLLLLLIFAATASGVTGEWFDAAIVLGIVVATVGIGYSREYSAERAADALRARLHVRTNVFRDGSSTQVSIDGVVPGDIVSLAAGSLVPADGVLLEATDFFVSEAALTGESFPVRKEPGTVAADTELSSRTNCVFLGTNVRSGTATALIVRTGTDTEFGAIARRLTLGQPETDFDRGVKRFGYLLSSAMLVMVLLVFVAHTLRGRPPIETLLFSVALAVGLSPELLPAILSVNLARGAQMMARCGVLVRRLNAIENLGNIDVLCTDKTGTITEGVVRLDDAYDAAGRRSERVADLAAVNAALETGISSPLDDAILAAHAAPSAAIRKLGEVPFDFVHKRVTVVIQSAEGMATLVTKGAFDHVLETCTALPDGPLDEEAQLQLQRRYEDWSRQGIRVLALATREIGAQPTYSRDDEARMTFEGFLTFLDRPKEGVSTAIGDLAALGVAVKVITGDSRLVAEHVAREVGLNAEDVLTGQQLDELHEQALWHAAERTSVFAEVDPNQKERIILALKRMGHVVGFLGDGVNDAPAMHAADTSLSVQEAVDVAREAADFVLLERDLDVIRRGIEEGRHTFANTLKYVLITTSANLGNMISMALASLVLPFLPLTAGQILLNNFLSDVPALGIADDNVDPEMVARPQRWNIGAIGRYMLEFGALSAAFDMLTFVVLLETFHAAPHTFQTGWFVESLLTELMVALVMRTRRPFFRSRPGTTLWMTTAFLIPFAMVFPATPLAPLFGMVPLSLPILATIVAIALLYILATELQKAWFYRRAA